MLTESCQGKSPAHCGILKPQFRAHAQERGWERKGGVGVLLRGMPDSQNGGTEDTKQLMSGASGVFNKGSNVKEAAREGPLVCPGKSSFLSSNGDKEKASGEWEARD